MECCVKVFAEVFWVVLKRYLGRRRRHASQRLAPDARRASKKVRTVLTDQLI